MLKITGSDIKYESSKIAASTKNTLRYAFSGKKLVSGIRILTGDMGNAN